jgi:hypothetical protein
MIDIPNHTEVESIHDVRRLLNNLTEVFRE